MVCEIKKEFVTIFYIDGDQPNPKYASKEKFKEKNIIEKRINYSEFFKYLVEAYGIGEIYFFFYFGIGKEDGSNLEKELGFRRKIDYLCNTLGEELKSVGVFIYKAYPLAKNNIDVNLASDVLDYFIYFKNKVKRNIKRVVLLAGDRDYAKVMRMIAQEGIEERYIISWEDAMSQYLKALATTFISLDEIFLSHSEFLI